VTKTFETKAEVTRPLECRSVLANGPKVYIIPWVAEPFSKWGGTRAHWKKL